MEDNPSILSHVSIGTNNFGRATRFYDSVLPSVGNGFHIGFFASSKKAVDDFHRAALKAGSSDDGAPGPRPEYGAPYYGCFVRDPDGHKIEATYWDTSLQQES